MEVEEILDGEIVFGPFDSRDLFVSHHRRSNELVKEGLVSD